LRQVKTYLSLTKGPKYGVIVTYDSVKPEIQSLFLDEGIVAITMPLDSTKENIGGQNDGGEGKDEGEDCEVCGEKHDDDDEPVRLVPRTILDKYSGGKANG
jgi:hypothetical protein